MDTRDALGTFLARSLSAGDHRIRKGQRLSADQVAWLLQAGIQRVVVACPDAGDVEENEAARQLALALAGPGVEVHARETGCCDLHATAAGLVRVDANRIETVNGTDAALALSTVTPWTRVEAGERVGMIKIIPFAVPGDVLADGLSAAGRGQPAISVAVFESRRVSLVQTESPGGEPPLLDKGLRVTRTRLAALGQILERQHVVAHEQAPLVSAISREARAGIDIILVLGAAATADAGDVLPEAIRAAGGEVLRLGMPVEPGHLTVLGRVGAMHVLGLPGCGRSPRVNGSDWILERLCAGVEVDARMIARMGVGGLLSHAPVSRNRRAVSTEQQPVAGIVLAAGRSSRMTPLNKLLLDVGGEPCVRRVARTALAAGLDPVVVVVGHAGRQVSKVLEGLPVRIVDNPAPDRGMSESLRAGVGALPTDIAGVCILLGDMPIVEVADVRNLAHALEPGIEACVPVRNGRRGNPVAWSRRQLAALASLSGDQGGRLLLAKLGERVREVPAQGDGVLIDIDTVDAVAALRERLASPGALVAGRDDVYAGDTGQPAR